MAKINLKDRTKRKKKIKRVLDTRERTYRRVAAIMGDGAGNVRASSRGKTFAYVRTESNHSLLICLNKSLPFQNDLKVWVGFSREMPTTLQVLSLREDPSSITLSVPTHHETHEYGNKGTDVVRVWGEQFMPWDVEPIGGMIVRAYRSTAQISGSMQFMDTQSFDLAPYKPSSGTVYAMIGFVGNNTIQAYTGPIRSSRSQLTFSDLPPIPTNFFPLCAVVLSSSTIEVKRSLLQTDFLDLRFLGYANNADKLDGFDGSFYSNPSNLSGTFQRIKANSAAPSPIVGQVQLVSGTASVNTTLVTANSRILLTHQNSSGTLGIPYVASITAGVGFTIGNTSAADNSNLAWFLVES